MYLFCSGSTIVLDMFFNAITAHKPDIVILAGLHLLEHQPVELWQEKLRSVKRHLGQLSPAIPLHMQIGSMADHEYAKNILTRVRCTHTHARTISVQHKHFYILQIVPL